MMVSLPRCASLCFSLLFVARASQWPVVQQSPQELLPNLELTLEPPQHPWPQVAAELGSLEESREQMENANMGALQQELNKATHDVRQRIGDTIGRIMHVFDDSRAAARHAGTSAAMLEQLPQDTLGSSVLSVKVNVLPASPPDPSLRPVIENLEGARSEKEKSMFETVSGEVSALSSFVVNELEAQLQTQVAAAAGTKALLRRRKSPMFLQSMSKRSPSQANVRVMPTDLAYPTVSSMVQDMEAKRDIVETLERKRILEKELDFLEACNHEIEEGLRAAVSRILAQYSAAAKSLRAA
jgi:hypothetical protein